MLFARIPTIIAGSVSQLVCLRGWSLQKSHEEFSAARVTAHLTLQETLVLTTPAFSTSNRIFD